MNVLIVGYGSMGHAVETHCRARGHTVIARIDPQAEEADAPQLTEETAGQADMAIEFSLPPGVLANAETYAKAGIGAVVGTTGVADQQQKIIDIVNSRGTAYLWGANFSVGAHLFLALVEKAAALANSAPEYDIMMTETHHNHKQDSPSGTALAAAEKIIHINNSKSSIQTETLHRQIRPEELHLSSLRGGSVPGTHRVMLDSAADTIEISHCARNRNGFALGAVRAAEWLHGKKGFFHIEDFIQSLIQTSL